jgi:hypothetical protein
VTLDATLFFFTDTSCAGPSCPNLVSRIHVARGTLSETVALKHWRTLRSACDHIERLRGGLGTLPRLVLMWNRICASPRRVA